MICFAFLLTSVSVGQDKIERDQYGEREVDLNPHPRDKEDTWTLNFRFKDPRIIEVEIPAVGKKRVWYMWYQVYNLTGEPRQFVPQFEFFSYDKSAIFFDQVNPSIQAEIIKREDPRNILKIKNSVTIALQQDAPQAKNDPADNLELNPMATFRPRLIPATKTDSYPRTTTGVAIWPTVDEEAQGTTIFSIFVAGLSDGFFEDDNGVIRRKTLQLNYRRSTDGKGTDTSDINLYREKKYEWIYRANSKTKKQDAPKEDPKEKAVLPVNLRR